MKRALITIALPTLLALLAPATIHAQEPTITIKPEHRCSTYNRRIITILPCP